MGPPACRCPGERLSPISSTASALRSWAPACEMRLRTEDSPRPHGQTDTHTQRRTHRHTQAHRETEICTRTDRHRKTGRHTGSLWVGVLRTPVALGLGNAPPLLGPCSLAPRNHPPSALRGFPWAVWLRPRRIRGPRLSQLCQPGPPPLPFHACSPTRMFLCSLRRDPPSRTTSPEQTRGPPSAAGTCGWHARPRFPREPLQAFC